MNVERLFEAPVAAVATAPGAGGVCVVRVSGAGALELGDRLTPESALKPSAREGGTFFHASVIHPVTRLPVDDAVVLVYRAPHSYTGEDTLELQGHGGSVSARRLLEAVLAAGAKPAAPGEFTRRAFLNGRMDLTQAEAVCDLIMAKTDRAAQAARVQLDGTLGQSVGAAYDALLEICAEVERLLDFDDGELPTSFIARTAGRLSDVITGMKRLVATWHEGRLLREGALVVISGLPNAGKSSLLNALLGHPRAIVHEQPGTTRDVIEEPYALNGVPLRLVDTAGLRECRDAVEREGVDRARGLIARADINMHVVDTSLAAGADESLAELSSLPDRKTLIVFSKADLQRTAPPLLPAGLAAVSVSAKSGEGMAELKSTLAGLLDLNDAGDSRAAVSQRHAAELGEAISQARAAAATLESAAPDLAVAASHLRVAAEALGRVTGRVYTDDLLDAVFSRFCVGK
ncbi:MAG: tRNA uridine-5-carboxymethylaminomethyl(34) synthesis GTPase MnmE [Kiritimatiellae bacterium]|nr:tRNA uridine-5-carboxymethylaminomethyl(34) synthesis GTPase MnmE [Kiritimatiellia bacterium]MDD4621898.1 tRNA uridine-5-carboxymethylaminomethyl(34) synthesis GTPase MnmE [Kiritimatiellia bacterium]